MEHEIISPIDCPPHFGYVGIPRSHPHRFRTRKTRPTERKRSVVTPSWRMPCSSWRSLVLGLDELDDGSKWCGLGHPEKKHMEAVWDFGFVRCVCVSFFFDLGSSHDYMDFYGVGFNSPLFWLTSNNTCKNTRNNSWIQLRDLERILGES